MTVTTSRDQTNPTRDPGRPCLATLADAPALLELFDRARPYEPETLEGMRAWLEHGGALFFVDETGAPLSALRWREEAGGWRVDRLATLEGARGRGYGRWLMTLVEAKAIRHNVPLLILTLTREELLPYYRRLGYQEQQRDPAGITLVKRVGGTWQTRPLGNGAPA